MRIRLVLLLVLAIGLSACSAVSGPKKDADQKPAIDVAVHADGEALVVSGTTTQPDHTKVLLLVGRNVKFAKDDMPRSTTVAKADVSVSGGRFRATLPVDESELVFDAGGERYGKVEAVADSVTACAQARPSGSSRPLEATATTVFPSPALPDLKAALGKAPRRERQLGQAYCAIESPKSP